MCQRDLPSLRLQMVSSLNTLHPLLTVSQSGIKMGNRAAKILINRLEADEKTEKRKKKIIKLKSLRHLIEENRLLNLFCYKTHNYNLVVKNDNIKCQKQSVRKKNYIYTKIKAFTFTSKTSLVLISIAYH
jgi:hypothetical protein